MRAQKTPMSSIYALLCVQEAIVWCCKIVYCEINLTALRLKSAVVSFCFCLTAVSAVCCTRPSALDSITQLIEFISTNIGSGKKIHTVDKNVCTLFLRLKTQIQFLKSGSENYLRTTALPFPLCLTTCPVHTGQNRQQTRRSLSPSTELSQRC